MRMRVMAGSKDHTYLSTQRNDPGEKHRLLSGCRVGLLVGSILATVIFAINLSIFLWANAKEGRFYTTSCERVKKVNMVIHLAINILSTLLLGASNYCMQCLCAPTRVEVDRAHAQCSWADIGVQSIRNLKLIKRWKVVAWLLLGLSSLPLHLVYNSVFSASISNNAYEVIILNGTLSSVSQLSMVSQATANGSLAQILNIASTSQTFEQLSNAACIDAYMCDFIDDRSNLVLVLGGKSPSEISLPYVVRAWTVKAAAPTNEDSHSYDWIKGRYTTGEVKRYANQWNLTDVSNTSIISGCLSQKVEPRCGINFNPPLGIVVVGFNIIKAFTITLVFVMLKGKPLVTVGDAISSFMYTPDRKTREWCLASAQDVQKAWELCGAHLDTRPSIPQPFQAKLRPYVSAVGARVWLMWISLFIIAIAGTSVCAGFAFYHMSTISGSPFVGLGEVNVDNIITGWDVSRWGITIVVLIANAPQTVLSFLYLVHNNMCTRMLLAAEWSDFANERKGLRMSEKAAFSSSQRSTYFLQIPYRYGIPLMMLSSLMHWLVSQSIYLAVIDAYDPWGHSEPDRNYVTCAYSPVATLSTAITGLILMLGTIYFAFAKKFSSGIPVAGSNSAAIAAACHPPNGGKNEKEPVMWGSIPEMKASPNGQAVTAGKSNVGHCSFSSGVVETPIQWRSYA